MSIFYIDSSVALHAIRADGAPEAKAWFDAVTKADEAVASSILLELEVIRTLRRDGDDLHEAADLLDYTAIITIENRILREAAAIEPHVKSLDAIHLATCLRLGGEATLVTHDVGMKAAAEHLGITTYDPIPT